MRDARLEADDSPGAGRGATPSAAASARRRRLKTRLLHLYAFLGPLGTLIPVPLTAPSFRLFYLLLIPGSIALALGNRLQRPAMRLALLLPVILYLVGSALHAATSEVGFGDPEEAGNPVARLGLLVCLLVFTVLSTEVVGRWSLAERLGWLRTFFRAYFLSLAAGYLLIIGYQFGAWDEDFIQRFQILVQRGFGMLRMSPGSYPNEYGIVSSFVLSTLVLLEVQRARWPLSLAVLRFPTRHFLWRASRLLLVLCALFLTTTRAAYLAFLMCVAYVALTQPRLAQKFKFLVVIAAFFGAVLLLTQPYFDAIQIFIVAYDAFFDEASSANERLLAWNTAFELFRSNELFGTGFGSVDMIHNVYLQLFFELGVVGCAVLFACAGLFVLTTTGPARPSGLTQRGRASELANWRLLAHVRNIGLIHVVWFAASNHSLNHFLTWFVVLLVPLSMRPRARRAARRANGPELLPLLPA